MASTPASASRRCSPPESEYGCRVAEALGRQADRRQRAVDGALDLVVAPAELARTEGDVLAALVAKSCISGI